MDLLNRWAGKPDFLCVAPHKTGTTWLYISLNNHPGIWLPPKKELWVLNQMQTPYWRRLFDLARGYDMQADVRRQFRRDIERIVARRSARRLAWWALYMFLPYTLQTYRILFPARATHLRGDITPQYYFLTDETIQALQRQFPDMKVLLILRQPTERVWSYVRMVADRFNKFSQPLDTVSESDLIGYFDELHTSWKPYPFGITQWKASFENVWVGYFDLLQADPAAFYREVCVFLGISHRPWREARRKPINVGPTVELPDTLRRYLNRQYLDEVRELARMTDSPYPRRWIVEME